MTNICGEWSGKSGEEKSGQRVLWVPSERSRKRTKEATRIVAVCDIRHAIWRGVSSHQHLWSPVQSVSSVNRNHLSLQGILKKTKMATTSYIPTKAEEFTRENRSLLHFLARSCSFLTDTTCLGSWGCQTGVCLLNPAIFFCVFFSDGYFQL